MTLFDAQGMKIVESEEFCTCPEVDKVYESPDFNPSADWWDNLICAKCDKKVTRHKAERMWLTAQIKGYKEALELIKTGRVALADSEKKRKIEAIRSKINDMEKELKNL